MNQKPSIKRLDVAGLRSLAQELGQKPYRGNQLAQWLYLRGADSFTTMDNLPADFRQTLEEKYTLGAPSVVSRLADTDGTRKYLLRLGDGNLVETVAIVDKRRGRSRLTACLSSQIGCAMGCIFCATGQMGLVRSLEPGEMLDQLQVIQSDYGEGAARSASRGAAREPTGKVAEQENAVRISNVVVMGQGEPFANYGATMNALRMINDSDLFGIGARHITVSTCGLMHPLRRFAEEGEQFTLAVSLHSAVQKTRDVLMPGLVKQPLTALREALLYYIDCTSRRPSLEYALIEGVNDSRAELEALIEFCHVPAPGFHVNLIKLNPSGQSTTTNSLGPSPGAVVSEFKKALILANITISVRVSKGFSIGGACGQLANQARL
ncbi:MAG: 23S rRNA (adenine(2503)-C(2))-methyltransferase RlmN [Coriobacteriales bacterium]|jgi:23S rRNA (adenine2503-C2)-methyltransferase|nr:23S rRNA (adenine(2503)-C(2))-methyltransferase RlmN [Coriobacteriales bacterium]